MSKTALIVGASRGLGLGLAKKFLSGGWQVIATERKESAEMHALAGLRIENADINKQEDIAALQGKLKGVTLDLLFVNAGVIDDLSPVGKVTTEEFTRLMVTNALSPLRVVETLADSVAPQGTIAVMTSGLGSISENATGGYEVYRASKAALNMLMKSYAVRAGGKRSLLCLHPGWVQTEMGGSAAPLNVETSVKGIYDTIAKRAGKQGVAFVSYADEAIGW